MSCLLRKWFLDVSVESDLQGAVAAVQIVQTWGVNELLIHTPQHLQRGEENERREKHEGRGDIYVLL